MINFQDAVIKILKNTQVLSTTKIQVEESVGHILAEDIYSKINMPPFNKSAMDGYALKAGDITKNTAKLRCIGTIQAGKSFNKCVKAGQCVKIMTGAAIPKGADSVIMVEDTRFVNDSVEILSFVKEGQNICVKGEDIRKNQKVIKKGIKISISDIALLASVGKQFIKVVRKPTAAFFNTGDEILPVTEKLTKNKIYNSNGPQLTALLKSRGIKADFLGIIKDNPRYLRQAIMEGLKYDLLLISGGVSMGDYDLIPKVLKGSGVKEVFHNIRIKPGKPLFFGVHEKTIIFGIPGNPVSSFTIFILFVQMAIYKMMGYQKCKPEFEKGILEKGFQHKTGRKHFVPVKVVKKKSQYYLNTVNSNGSADIVSLSTADGFMAVEEDVPYVKSKSKVNFILWEK
ncbi:MAG: gephyrin-like molybdotransferase Glp [Candidatus Omnitrophota bacterium]